jgi:hypothetical protein
MARRFSSDRRERRDEVALLLLGRTLPKSVRARQIHEWRDQIECAREAGGAPRAELVQCARSAVPISWHASPPIVRLALVSALAACLSAVALWPHASPQLIDTTADNYNGILVFADPEGRPASEARIPFGTAVQVVCETPNVSGMTSVNAFYRLETPQWTGLYAPANTFTNGAQLGQATAADPLDRAVPRCRDPIGDSATR